MATEPPDSLLRNLNEKRTVLFAGAGLSKGAGLPTWRELLDGMVDRLLQEKKGVPEKEVFSKLLEAEKFLEVADCVKDNLSQFSYNDYLVDILSRDQAFPIPEVHKIITKLPFSAVVTTNYDKLFEQAYSMPDPLLGLPAVAPRAPKHTDTQQLARYIFKGDFFILKAHGDIDDQESLVLSVEDYQKIINSNPAFNMLFSAILLTKSILFIGYSLSDPDFRLLLDRQFTTFRGAVPDRYALMRGVSQIERDVLWRTANITVLECEHEETVEFLRSLEKGLVRESVKTRT